MFLLLLLLSPDIPPPKPVKVLTAECDILEINEVWKDGGFDELTGLPNPPEMSLKQVILWDLHTPKSIFPSKHEKTEHHVRAWYSYNHKGHRIVHVHGEHPNEFRMWCDDKEKLLVVRFRTLRARWTLGWDPELEDRKLFPVKWRKPLEEGEQAEEPPPTVHATIGTE